MPLSHIIDLLPKEADAYLVGGTVRDILIGRAPLDIDIAVAQDARQFAFRLASDKGGRIVEMGTPGKRVYRVLAEGRIHDITALAGGSLEPDLRRRDFTINAMAISLKNGTLTDFHNGQGDLASAKIRMVHPDAFRQDPVRLLRAFRLGANLNFRIETRTAQAIARQAALITAAAAERIREELFKTFRSPHTFPYLRDMAAAGLLFHLFPELQPLQACRQNPEAHRFDAWEHTLAAFEALERILTPSRPQNSEGFARLSRWEKAWLKTALLLHDIGKPLTRSVDPSGGVHFYGHEKVGAAMAIGIAERLRLSTRERRFIHFIIGNHLRPLHLFKEWSRGRITAKAQTRFFMTCASLTPPLLAHALADMRGKGRGEAANNAFAAFIYSQMEAFGETYTRRKSAPPLITGHDLMRALDLKPSPVFRRILDHVAEEQLSGGIQNKRQALAAAAAFLKRLPGEAPKKAPPP